MAVFVHFLLLHWQHPTLNQPALFVRKGIPRILPTKSHMRPRSSKAETLFPTLYHSRLMNPGPSVGCNPLSPVIVRTGLGQEREVKFSSIHSEKSSTTSQNS